jgi:non-ribosomal peptide synthetase component F
MLAVLRAGGAFVPLDPSHPFDRLRGLCDSVGAKLVLCSSHLAQRLIGVVATVLPVDDTTITDSIKESKPRATSAPAANSTNAAYIIFTSGSTGKPKVSKPGWR